MREIEIKGFEGLYTINDSGVDEQTVFSLKSGKYLQPLEDGEYKRVKLYKEGHGKLYKLHRLIAEAFIPNPQNKPCIDHKKPLSEGGTNEISNLHWVTYYENNHNPISEEKRCKALKNNSSSHEVHQYTKDGELVKIWESVGECARNGYNKGHVAACCRGEQQSHKGFIWKYSN